MTQAEQDLQATLTYLREATFAALSGGQADEEDHEILDRARRDLHPDSQVLRTVAGKLASSEHADQHLEALNRLLEAVLEAASRGIVTGPVWKFVKDAQAKAARAGREAKRNEDPNEQIIIDAIQAATIGWDGQKKFKLAGVISANLLMQDVKITARAISGRLEKWKLLKSFTDENGSS